MNELNLPLEAVAPSPLNPRLSFDAGELSVLANSLKVHGQLTPLLVRPIDGRTFDLICGERRLRAARLANLPTLRATVLAVDDREAVELRGLDNVLRKNFNAIEEGRWIEQMLAHGYTQQNIADRLKVSQPWISKRVRLLRLPDKWQQRIISRQISAYHVEYLHEWIDRPDILARVDTAMLHWTQRHEDHGLTARVFERLVAEAVMGCAARRPAEATPAATPAARPTKRKDFSAVRVRMTWEQFSTLSAAAGGDERIAAWLLRLGLEAASRNAP